MIKKIKRLKITTFIILAIEIVALCTFVAFYLKDFNGIKAFFEPEYFIYIATGLLVLDGIIFLCVLSAISKKRTSDDLKTVNVMGRDIRGAFEFGRIGFAVIDEESNVLWISSFLTSKNFDMVSKNIYDWCPELKNIMDKDPVEGLTVMIKNNYYSVKYIRSAGLFIFRDIHDQEYNRKLVSDKGLVLGIIMIDNYADIVGPTEDNSDVMDDVKAEIVSYFRDRHFLLRQFRSDAYMAVGNHKDFKAILKDGFSVLDKIRELVKGKTSQPTLSIGFACEFEDAKQTHENATSALDIAMSRGGDQAVVSRKNSELQFFGGKTEAIEKRSKVKVRIIADALISYINNADNVIVMGHTNADMDAIGSSLGIKAVCDSLNKNCKVVFESKLYEKKARVAVTSQFTSEELKQFAVTTKEAKELVNPKTLIVVVDVSKPSLTLCPELLELGTKIICIDHHRRGEEFIDNALLPYVEPSSSSASELIAELIRYSSNSDILKVPPKIATIMLSGIFLDTGFFKTKTVGLRTFEACSILKEFGADNALADELLKDEFEEFALVNSILSTYETFGLGVVCCTSQDEEMIDRATLAKVADQCNHLKGVNCAFAVGKIGKSAYGVSARSDGSINVQTLCEKMGQGGGHFAKAACVINAQSVTEAHEVVKRTIEQYLSDARNLEAMKGEI